MSCATPEQLAAGDVDAAHVAACLTCRRALDDQRAVRAALARLEVRPLAADRRRTLAAEVMARADLRDDTRALRPARGRLIAGALATVALAAAGMLALRPRAERATVANVELPAAEQPASASTSAAREPAVPAPAPAPDEDPARPEVVEATAPAAPDARASKIDRARQVFGSTADARRHALERDLLVEGAPLAEFRVGWEALRARSYDEAIAAFDRATDPAVAEDAAFWAAIAAQRAGYDDTARKRLDAFLTRFPDSPRAERARRAREVLR